MAINCSCPGCQQPLQVPEDYLGRSVACPSCKYVFRIGPAPQPPPPPPRIDEDRRQQGGRNDDYDDDDRPYSRRRNDDFDDSPRRRFRYDVRADASDWAGKANSAHTMGLLSCVLCWLPLIGLILGIVAYSSASNSLNLMQEDRSDDFSTRVRFEKARTLSIIGIIISSIMFVSCCSLNFLMIR